MHVGLLCNYTSILLLCVYITVCFVVFLFISNKKSKKVSEKFGSLCFFPYLCPWNST